MFVRDYSGRKIVIIGVFILITLIYLVRLFYLQIIDNRFKLSADNIVLRTVRQYPPRGRIYDRNHKLLVYNEAAYDILVIPRQVKKIDTNEFCNLLGIDTITFDSQFDFAKKYSQYRPSVFLKQLSKKDFGIVQEKLYQFPGFYSQTRTLRHYPQPIAAHLLGNIGEVSQQELDKDNFYKAGDYIGKSGIEKYYEKQLRGEKGMKIIEVDVYNRDKGSYMNGKYDTLAAAGKDITLGLDADLQEYGEQLMQNKIGSIVAIDPRSGEILAMVSSPSFDPNMLVGRERSKNFTGLLDDTLKPIMNRAIMGTYPPGSTFKIVNGLIALQEKAIWEGTEFTCQGKLSSPIKCTHDHVSPLALQEAIQQSCNSYFWKTFRNTLNNTHYTDSHAAYENWYKHVMSFGFGQKFNTDIPYELSGNIPDKDYYDELYHGVWNALTVRSLAIGQGEILVTPIQLANLAVIIANRGYYFPPHVVKSIEGNDTITKKYNQKILTNIEPKYFDIIKKAMRTVFNGEHGTARYYNLDSIAQCGKTGTVQNPHGDDHSIFIAFAPMKDPKIALSVIVENSGYGSKWAAPIASLMIEKYLTRKITRKKLEKRMLEGNLINQKDDQTADNH